jgi:tyrosyl-tRNA synthetase
MDVDGEIGGNDQTFNMLAGRTLMKNLNNKEKIVIATKLLVDPTGKKMGKTEGNIVALNQTPEDMFGKVMSWSDELIIPGLEILTDMPGEEIESIKEEYAEGKSNPKEYKITLAKEIIRMIYKSEGMDVAEEKAQKAAEAFTNTFSKGGVPEDVTEIEAKEGDLLVDLLLASNIIESKTEWRRLVEDGAVKEMDKDEKISDPNSKALTGTYKIGKRRFIKIKN